MADEAKPVATDASAVPPSRSARSYPKPFAGRVRRALGHVFGLTHFGVNLTRLPPGAMSALRHTHSGEDEFVYGLRALSRDQCGRDRDAPRNARTLQGRLGQRPSLDQPHRPRDRLSRDRRPQTPETP
jgi:hypothetical protein